jgi:NAD(P)-dependent dehydrogenase (short-subunit alcohol dehydrogenase family)
VNELAGRFAVITGASQGLGEAIATHFVDAGASVLLCARSREKLEAVTNVLRERLQKGQMLYTRVADVAQTENMDALADNAFSMFPCVDILVNNAGVYGPIGPLEENDWQEWLDAIAINLMGTVYTCRAFVPHFRKRKYGKIINLSGGGATNPLPRISAYAATKAAVVRFTETLAEELRDANVDVNAVAPGALATQMMDQVIAAGESKVGAEFLARMTKIREEGGTPLSKGAELCVYLASAASDGITGKLISAVWDPWRELGTRYRGDVERSDIYTLRRIVPADRGKDWGK